MFKLAKSAAALVHHPAAGATTAKVRIERRPIMRVLMTIWVFMYLSSRPWEPLLGIVSALGEIVESVVDEEKSRNIGK